MTPTERLTRRLAGLGYVVTLFVPTLGFWRKQDCMRWECYANGPDGRSVNIGSWDTVTDCARRGFTLESDNADRYKGLVAYANPKTKD